ncbi:hypothetical protein VaNZ11_015565 [Volvox africanus]|uniref:AAA+ ATPase domain-containing protein n=1 Tax=Volvox africanus TaxID=51714 RepID=A0ABQ5SL45_9CHLO|nr:hypothetical protein VaNZ11_015565 [Volvox africanus]
MHAAIQSALTQISFRDAKRGWGLLPPQQLCLNPALNVVAQADRRGTKNKPRDISQKHQQQRGSRKGSPKGPADGTAEVRNSSRADDSREAQRGRELQRAALRASSRAEVVSASRLELQGRLLASQVVHEAGNDEDDGDWAAVAAAAAVAATGGGDSGGIRRAVGNTTRLPFPLPLRPDSKQIGGRDREGGDGGGGSGGGATATSGTQRNAQRGETEEELWPSREAVTGSSQFGLTVGDVTEVAEDTRSRLTDHRRGGGSGRDRGSGSGSGKANAVFAAGPPGLVQALRAAQSADQQNRMMIGGSGLGVATAAAGTGTGLGQGEERPAGRNEDLMPYVDVALKALALPPRPRSAARGDQNRQRREQPEQQTHTSPGDSNDFGADEHIESDEGEDEAGGGVRRGGGARGSTTRGRGAKRGALRDLLESYQRIWCRALDLELQEEWTESEERLKSWKRPRLEAEGYALFDLTAAPDHNLFRDAILRFCQPARPLPYHCLGAGDIVLVSPSNRPGEASLEGVVLDFSSRWIRVALPLDLAHGVQGSGWRLDLYANTIAHERARGAVKRYCQSAAESGSSKSNGSGSDNDDNNSGGGGSLGILRALAGSTPAGTSLEQMASAPPPWLRGKAGRERLTAARRVVAAATRAEVEQTEPTPVPTPPPTTGLPLPTGAAITRPSGGGGNSGRGRRGPANLNASQAHAIEAALGRNLTLWQGPPGTGKTATLLHFIRAALAALPPGSGPLLATAASNVAVDGLVSGLRALDPSLDVVRVGQPVKVAPELRGVSLEARIAGTAAGQRAARLRRQAQGLRGSEAWTFISQALELEEAAARDILSGAQVVAATCIGCGEARMQALSFPVVVLDEATQATEPHSLVPLLGQVRQVVLVGDPKQLPPTVKSQEAAELGLNIPLFERLQLMGLVPLLLDTQYRMHPAIAAFPSATFYGGKLLSAPDPRDRPPPRAFPWPNPKVPVCFIPVRGRESRTNTVNDAATPGGAAGYSYQNNEEAEMVAAVVAALLTPGSVAGLAGPGDIGIVTPYNGQVRCLQQLLINGSRLSRGLGQGARPRSFLHATTIPTAAASSDDEGLSREGAVLEIKSVDGFQGREKEVIVFSTVRSNPAGQLGFVADGRRLNVAITRARRGLVVLGNPDTLAKDRLWARWLRWVTSKGCILEGLSPNNRPAGGAGGGADGVGADGSGVVQRRVLGTEDGLAVNGVASVLSASEEGVLGKAGDPSGGKLWDNEDDEENDTDDGFVLV